MDVLTNRYNAARTGANPSEAVLNQGNVNVNTFGKLFARGVDGQIYAQPLVVSNLDLPGVGARSVVFVATSRNMVYAFDSENAHECHPFWRVNLDGTNETPVPRTDYGTGYVDFTSEIGVTSTPVIDRGSETIYLTSKSKKVVDGKPHYLYKLHALSITSGAAKFGGPGLIAETQMVASDFNFISGPTANGHGKGNIGGKITFNAFYQLQRPGLLLQDEAIYLAFASQGDKGTYHGWILAYDAKTLALLASYCTTPDWGEGGVWQSGCGLAGDGAAGNLYAVCGNGDPLPENLSGQALARQITGPFFGQSVLKLRLDRGGRSFVLEDWFVTKDIVEENKTDIDADFCAGPVLLPWGNLMGAWGKDRAYYILDRSNMGKFDPNTNAIAQYAPDMTRPQNGGGTGHIHCAPVVFDDNVVGPVSYVWGENDRLRGYPFDTGKMLFATSTPPNLLSDNILPVGMPGGMLTLSCNGQAANAKAGSAIVWALHPTAGDANHHTVAGTLQAYKADDLRLAIWSSNHDPNGADDLGDFAKFCPPVVANGRVYVATFSNQLVVYGLLSEGLGSTIGDWLQADIPIQKPGNPVFRVEGTANFSCGRFTILGAGEDIFGAADAFHYVYQNVRSGIVVVTARVVSVQNTDAWAKSGVMIRATLDPDSPQAMTVITPGNGAAFQYRQVKGGQTVHVPFGTLVRAPFWVRVMGVPAGQGFQFDGFVSLDGTRWDRVGSAPTISMPANAFAGMAVTAHTGTLGQPLQDLCASLLDRVSIT